MTTHAGIHHAAELHAAAPVFEHLGVDPATVIPGDRPDLVLPDYEGKCIGIEVVELRPSALQNGKKGDSMAKVSDRMHRACRHCEKRLEAQGELHTHIYLMFTDNASRMELGISDRMFQQRVFEEVERHRRYDSIAQSGHLSPKEYIRMHRAGCFNYEYVSMCRTKPVIFSTTVLPISAYFIAPVERDHVEAVVHEKEKKLEAYKQMPHNSGIDEYWLVIYLPQEEHYGIDKLEPFEIKTRFARIYLTELLYLRQLKTVAP